MEVIVDGEIVTKKRKNPTKKSTTKPVVLMPETDEKIAVTSEDDTLKYISVTQAKECAGNWMSRKTYCAFRKKDNGLIIDSVGISITGMTTGCGSGQMSGIASLKDTPVYRELFEECIDKYIIDAYEVNKSGRPSGGPMPICGFVATLGDSYKGVQKYIKKFGFIEVGKYRNMQHGAGYMQTMYHFQIDPTRFEKRNVEMLKEKYNTNKKVVKEEIKEVK